VIPAYNEKQRLPKMLEETIRYFKSKNIKFEIVIVNDGSKDLTWDSVEKFIKSHNETEIIGISYKKNTGKGFAVTVGMKYTRGKYILMLDADGATSISDYEKLRYRIEKLDTENNVNGAMVIGSRNHLLHDPSIVSTREWHRNVLMHINNAIVRYGVGIPDIKDTQCGFKLFTRKAAKNIFLNMHLTRWAFDVEILYIAKQYKIFLILV
jgi:dolichyl-phosphate beta-glucosyltransferase